MLNLINEMMCDLGCSTIDKDMIILCSMFAAIGGIMHILMLSSNHSEWPGFVRKELQLYRENTKESWKDFSTFLVNTIYVLPQFIVHIMLSKPYWIVGRIMLSAFSGLIIALYFLGSFPAEGIKPTGPARVFILCALFGYATPAILLAQEKWIVMLTTSGIFRKKLLEVMEEINSSNTAAEKEKTESNSTKD